MKTFNLLLLADIISIIPLVIILSLMYNFLIAPGKNVVDIILALVIILANFSVEKIKRLPWPREWDSVTRRPKGAMNTDYLSRNGPAKPRAPGMPSGHMTSTSLFAIFMLFCVWSMKYQKDTKKFIQQEWLFILINLSLIGLMAFARYYKKCHNIPQIIAGTLYGGLIGYVAYYVLEKLDILKIRNKEILDFNL